MVDAPQPPDCPPPLDSLEELQDVWNQFRAGASVPCPRDGAPLALAVDGAAGLYRFICTGCITASPWFESDARGIRIRGHSESGPAPSPGDD